MNLRKIALFLMLFSLSPLFADASDPLKYNYRWEDVGDSMYTVKFPKGFNKKINNGMTKIYYETRYEYFDITYSTADTGPQIDIEKEDPFKLAENKMIADGHNLINSKYISLNGYKGREYLVYYKDKSVILYRMFLVGNTMYQLAYGTTKHINAKKNYPYDYMYRSRNGRIFLDSFSIKFIKSDDFMSTNAWQKVYTDDAVTIEMETSKVGVGLKGIGRVTFRWTWSELHPLKMTPGVSYKSRIEITEINCIQRKFHTVMGTAFDERGNQIEFNRIVPSIKWDTVQSGSIMDAIFPKACELIYEKQSDVNQ